MGNLLESYNTPLEHTPSNPPSRLWKKSLLTPLGKVWGCVPKVCWNNLWESSPKPSKNMPLYRERASILAWLVGSSPSCHTPRVVRPSHWTWKMSCTLSFMLKPGLPKKRKNWKKNLKTWGESKIHQFFGIDLWWKTVKHHKFRCFAQANFSSLPVIPPEVWSFKGFLFFWGGSSYSPNKPGPMTP